MGLEGGSISRAKLGVGSRNEVIAARQHAAFARGTGRDGREAPMKIGQLTAKCAVARVDAEKEQRRQGALLAPLGVIEKLGMNEHGAPLRETTLDELTDGGREIGESELGVSSTYLFESPFHGELQGREHDPLAARLLDAAFVKRSLGGHVALQENERSLGSLGDEVARIGRGQSFAAEIE